MPNNIKHHIFICGECDRKRTHKKSFINWIKSSNSKTIYLIEFVLCRLPTRCILDNCLSRIHLSGEKNKRVHTNWKKIQSFSLFYFNKYKLFVYFLFFCFNYFIPLTTNYFLCVLFDKTFWKLTRKLVQIEY